MSRDGFVSDSNFSGDRGTGMSIVSEQSGFLYNQRGGGRPNWFMQNFATGSLQEQVRSGKL